MPSSRPSLSFRAILLLFLITSVRSKHIHRRRLHEHARQVDISSSPNDITTSPSTTASEAVVSNTQITQGSQGTLSANASNFLLTVEQRLQELETLLQGFFASATGSPVAPTGILSTTANSVAGTNPPWYSSAQSWASSTGSSAGFTTVTTQTSTSSYTETHWIPIPTSQLSYPSVPLGDGTASSYPSVTIPATTASTALSTTNATAVPSYSTTVSYSFQPSPSPYTFSPDSESNVAVYYGQTEATTAGGLLTLCQNANVDIVLLAFVTQFSGPQGYPSIELGPGCSGPSAAQSARAPGLTDCSALAPEITGCQAIGKKVLLSLGGYLSNTSFVSDAQASQFAAQLWGLFGADPGGADADLRPFGPAVVLDGFDIDNEDHNTTFYATFATALRQAYAGDPTRTYYLSAAPQCPLPDQSIPLAAMLQCDFVWVQFYNNPACNLNTTGFAASFAAWSQTLAAPAGNATGYGGNATSGGGNATAGPRLFIGAGAYAAAGPGYVAGAEFGPRVGLARGLNVSNLGGVMLWDGSEALANVDPSGRDYLSYAKGSLQ